MTDVPLPKRPKLERVTLATALDGKKNIVISLIGKNLANTLNELQSAVDEKKIPPALIEFDEKKNLLTIRAAAPTDEVAADMVEAVYDKTYCRLGDVSMKAHAIPIRKTRGITAYEAGFIMKPIEDIRDPDNRISQFSMEIIRRQHNGRNHSVCDPRAEAQGVTLIRRIDKQFHDKNEALHHAEAFVQEVRKQFCTPPSRLFDLTLTGLNVEGNQFSAAFMGSKESLEWALVALQTRCHNVKVHWNRSHDRMRVTVTDSKPIDNTDFLKIVHETTGYALPMHIEPGAIPVEPDASIYNPILETHFTSDMQGNNLEPAKTALGRYTALHVPGSTFVIPQSKGNQPHVVVAAPFSREQDAFSTAEAITKKVADRMREKGKAQKSL